MTFYFDRRTIFEYYSKKMVNIEKDTFAQFEAACDKLGIEIITTSIAQSKDKVERLFGTFQSRLVAELRLNNINTIEKANKFVLKYLPVYNKQFALPINYDKSFMEESPSIDLINLYLSVFTNKTVNNGSTVKHKGKLYYPELSAHALLVYIVLLLLSLLLLFQNKSGSVTFSTYSIYVTIITMDILFFGNKMETLFSSVYYCKFTIKMTFNQLLFK